MNRAVDFCQKVVHIRGLTSNFLLGAGFAYAIEKEYYHHLPIALLFPSAYAGYQAYRQVPMLRTPEGCS
jgi:hypothetical protein